MARPKGQPKLGGRKKGTPNKVNAAVKDMILQALNEAHPKGGVAYLKMQALTNPVAFMTLVGKVLPLQIAGDKSAPLTIIMRCADGQIDPDADDE